MTSADAGRGGRSTRIRTRARTRLILERRRGGGKVTKVLGLGRSRFSVLSASRVGPWVFLGTEHLSMKQGLAWLRRMIGVAWCLVAATAWAQAGRPSLQCPQTTGGLYAR